MRSGIYILVLATFTLLGMARSAPADAGPALLRAAKNALAKGELDRALTLVDKSISKDPKNAEAYLVRGIIHESQQRHKEAVADFDQAIKLDRKLAEAYQRRGQEHFKLGHIKESIDDFDRYLELQPEKAPGHWQRGISYYYAGRFDEGRKQFAAYENVDTNDVENAVWHFICYARVVGLEKARTSMLKIGFDKRVPLMKVYDLFAGKAKPEDVLAAVKEAKPSREELKSRLFYANLYLGLYYEA
ncbi:MAG TPA: tetratricopeptide repeat protein, partial [Gemmataceae bacterium]|nr:tetratricopeptide repeat protein [Gemmataceae bacterium]